jgi:hypothetical protein
MPRISIARSAQIETCHSTVLARTKYPFKLIFILVLVVFQYEDTILFSLND